MANKQQTAVEWFAQRIQSDKIFNFDVVLKKALQMEREQIETDYIVGIIHPLEMEASKQSKEYYNDTYGTQRSPENS